MQSASAVEFARRETKTLSNEIATSASSDVSSQTARTKVRCPVFNCVYFVDNGRGINEFVAVLQLAIKGMTCASCVGAIESALKSEAGVQDVVSLWTAA